MIGADERLAQQASDARNGEWCECKGIGDLGGEKEFIQGSGLGVHCVDGAKVNVSMGFFLGSQVQKDEGQSRNGASAEKAI
ncbi:hypothetical protein L5515_014873 [Caenorhabditis briggsae]|uniref:Uncharacterized protein n=1 Tax=Caenorhabditis briggsae TaxID=6238 RepID=A0AAE9IV41_CAEBR|nr:hypothetical protein L3Y34_018757 [Caenorhabditis briggsae]UMM19125.1 hypothetical protein L5515_014873 [Caenorhabditis briggsae]